MTVEFILCLTVDISEEPASKKARRRSALPCKLYFLEPKTTIMTYFLAENEVKLDHSETGSNLLDKSSTLLTVSESADLSELKKEQDTVESVKDETTKTDLVPDDTLKGESEDIILSLEEGQEGQNEENDTM